MPAQRLATMVDTNVAVRFGMVCCSGSDAVRVASAISAKTWVAMRRNSGQRGA
jgi:hypothetical protein